MTTPPLPASPCLRVRLDYTQTDNLLGGSRFFLSYAGAAPTAGNCSTIAAGIATAWADEIASLIHETWALTQVDVLDIASYSGASGSWEGSDAGGETGAECPANVAQNVEFGIARRYRGGKPRMFFPPSGAANLADASHWTDSQTSDLQTNTAAMFAAIAALSVGAVGALAHVNLSYYSGFTNHTNTSGRERAVPTYRDTAQLDPITSYIAKRLVGSQRRRRSATTF